MKPIILSLFLVVFLNGCGGGGNANQSTGETTFYHEEIATQKAQLDSRDTDGSQAVITEQMLIKRGNFSFQTGDVDKKHAEILELVTKYQAYVSNDNSYISHDRKTYNTEIRLPKQFFDAFVNDLSQGVSHFDHKEVGVEDVTEEYVDINARLKTKKELEARYLELLSKAKTVSEMLEIEKQIGELQADIESIEGRLKYITQQVQFSTLNLSYYEKTSVGNRFGQQFLNGFKNGWNNFIWFFVGLVNIWPFIILFGLFIYFFAKWLRRKRRNQS
ncbi:MAG: DUF4349 domain-containing protein [Flavobacteriaceae bacterium]|nr:DUF4349 domain-containing protein [Flavobacteriaceae bacterium]